MRRRRCAVARESGQADALQSWRAAGAAMDDEVAEVFRSIAPLGAAVEAAADPADTDGEANAAGAGALTAEAVEEADGVVVEPPPKRQRLSQGPLGHGRWQRTRSGQAVMTQVRL